MPALSRLRRLGTPAHGTGSLSDCKRDMVADALRLRGIETEVEQVVGIPRMPAAASDCRRAMFAARRTGGLQVRIQYAPQQ